LLTITNCLHGKPNFELYSLVQKNWLLHTQFF
jgi:hypothetical protein